MDEARLEQWQDLHVRACRGISLTAEEQLKYDAGCLELDEEELGTLKVTGLQEALERTEVLEQELAKLMAQKQKLDAEIATRLSKLKDSARNRLKVGA